VHQRFGKILLTWYFFSFSTKTRFTTNGYTDPTSGFIVFIVFIDAQIFIQKTVHEKATLLHSEHYFSKLLDINCIG
jgi:hypothetical protein